MSAEQVPESKLSAIQPIPMHQRIPKRWVLAKRRNGVQQQLHNEAIENEYHFKPSANHNFTRLTPTQKAAQLSWVLTM